MVVLLQVSPLRVGDLLESDCVRLDPATPTWEYVDVFGNRCSRFLASPGQLRLWSSALIKDSGLPDPIQWDARQVPVQDLPVETLQYLLSSRYCEVDRLSNTATELFGSLPMGWPRVQAVCDWVYRNVTFGYQFARNTKTALDVYTDRTGVCRDLQHLAITFCRCLNIPARYATGYLGDIGIPPVPYPMDFSAWFEAYLNDHWWAFDARHNQPRIGRILVAVGRDAADVAITTSFGQTNLTGFTVVTQEVAEI
jgi:transglutaminase-like putative cysteine protease